MSLQRVAVVTGSNKGIGFATVQALLNQFKGDVYLTSRDQKRGKNAMKALKTKGIDPKFHLLDVSDTRSIGIFNEHLMKEYGGVDVFIHNAGVMFSDSDPMPFGEVAKTTVGTNYHNMVNVCNSILPMMKSNGRLVILSSGLSLSSFRNCSKEIQEFFKSRNLTEETLTLKMNEFVDAAQSGKHLELGFANNAYGISKMGVNAFTRILAKRTVTLKAKNVLVNCCCPGWVQTDMGGPKAHLTPEQGAESPIMLALLPEINSEPNGEFMQRKKIVKWY